MTDIIASYPKAETIFLLYTRARSTEAVTHSVTHSVTQFAVHSALIGQCDVRVMMYRKMGYRMGHKMGYRMGHSFCASAPDPFALPIS